MTEQKIEDLAIIIAEEIIAHKDLLERILDLINAEVE
jgi:hypothetical protein